MLDIVEYLGQQIGVALETLARDDHFAWPVFVTVIASNGSMIGAHYRTLGEDARVVARHIEGPGFRLPINLVFVSSGDGRAANVVISRWRDEEEGCYA
jgi:hypothetical protein